MLVTVGTWVLVAVDVGSSVAVGVAWPVAVGVIFPTMVGVAVLTDVGWGVSVTAMMDLSSVTGVLESVGFDSGIEVDTGVGESRAGRSSSRAATMAFSSSSPG